MMLLECIYSVRSKQNLRFNGSSVGAEITQLQYVDDMLDLGGY